jgi:steroid delta-isomerase-like uncharacterized protein
MNPEQNQQLVRRWWEELWNQWDFTLVHEIATPDLAFRGSLGRNTTGAAELHEYMRTVRDAFPDFHTRIEQIVAEGDHVAVRLTFTGTHRGELFGYAPTGREMQYSAAAFFTIRNGKIASGWVLGDLQSLREQLAGVSITP